MQDPQLKGLPVHKIMAKMDLFDKLMPLEIKYDVPEQKYLDIKLEHNHRIFRRQTKKEEDDLPDYISHKIKDGLYEMYSKCASGQNLRDKKRRAIMLVCADVKANQLNLLFNVELAKKDMNIHKKEWNFALNSVYSVIKISRPKEKDIARHILWYLRELNVIDLDLALQKVQRVWDKIKPNREIYFKTHACVALILAGVANVFDICNVCQVSDVTARKIISSIHIDPLTN